MACKFQPSLVAKQDDTLSSRDNDVRLSVAIDIDDFELVTSDADSLVENRAIPHDLAMIDPVLVRDEEDRIGRARVAVEVGPVPLSGHELWNAVSVEIDERG